jgi:hypothetical protein
MIHLDFILKQDLKILRCLENNIFFSTKVVLANLFKTKNFYEF